MHHNNHHPLTVEQSAKSQQPSTHQNADKQPRFTLHIIVLTLVATLGGLLFGYDTAVVNGAEKSLVTFFIAPIFTLSQSVEAHVYASKLVSQFHIILVITLYLVYTVVALQFFKLLGGAKGFILNVILFCALSYWAYSLLHGSLLATNKHDIANAIKGFVLASALIGCVIGGAVAGFIAKAIGRKRGLIIAAILFVLSALGASFPERYNIFGVLPVYAFVFYRIIGGVGVGIASMLSPMYIAEIAPRKIRGHLVSWNQFAIILGMLIIYFVNYMIASSGNETWLMQIGWRYMFLSGVLPAALFLLLLFFVPETPRYLVSIGNNHQALQVLKRLTANEQEALGVLNDIQNTMQNKHAPWLSFGYSVIIIGIMLSVFQQFVGINVVLYYAGNIFRNMGFDTNASIFETIIVGVINLLFTVIAILFVDKVGRKPLLIIGAIGMACSMFALGGAFYWHNLGVFALAAMLVYVAAFALSWGPIVWVMLAEIFPNSIRGAMSIAVSMQWIANFLVSFTFPMLNDNIMLTAKFNHGLAYGIYGIIGLLAALFVWRFVPETKHKSLEEMEQLWQRNKRTY